MCAAAATVKPVKHLVSSRARKRYKKPENQNNAAAAAGKRIIPGRIVQRLSTNKSNLRSRSLQSLPIYLLVVVITRAQLSPSIRLPIPFISTA